jgi:NADH-quinone oxidoreductase subunit G
MPKLTIDDIQVEVPQGTTILQAAESIGKEIPVFCYHPRLSIAGNCRMCLVDVERSPKPVASCSMPVAEGMVVHTSNERAKKAQNGVLEFLLINHPLDCPICDQGGECDLQDLSMAYGKDCSRYTDFDKRAVSEKYLGPLIKTAMTRCIHCTRCVRFSTEIAGVPEMGATGRGEHMEIGTYISKAVASELSGNMIDICPVGALLSKPYSFRGRPWELSNTQSIDVMDAVGSAIRIGSRGREVMRILPRLNEQVNEEWIADKARFSYDGLKSQRLDRPYVRSKGGKLNEASWDEAFGAVANKIAKVEPEAMAALAGDQADCESMVALMDLMEKLGSPHLDCRQDGSKIEAGPRVSYTFNTSIAGIEDADYCLIVGSNPRWEAPLINARIRKNYLATGLKVALLGPEVELGYPIDYLGNTPDVLEQILVGSHPVAKKLKAAKAPMLILGQAALNRADGKSIWTLCAEIAEKYGLIYEGKGAPGENWNGFNILHTAASRVGGLDMGFVPGKNGLGTLEILKKAESGEMKLVYLLGADEIDTSKLKDTFVIYQGHHGDKGAQIANVILPGAAYTEKSATYVNTEGRVQRVLQAVATPGAAKEDWKIVRALSEKLDLTLPYDSLDDIRARLVEVNPLFDERDMLQRSSWQTFGRKGKVKAVPFVPVIENYYMTDPISRNSRTMVNCTREILGWEQSEGKSGTDG